MKILYVGVYKDGTGYGNAAIDYILALDSIGIEIVPRNIKLNNTQVEIPDRILELEKKDDSGCDIIVQHILPSMMQYNGNFNKNIGIYCSETTHFTNSRWAENLNLMDQCIVCNCQMLNAARMSGVYKPITVVPYATDISKYTQYYNKIEIPELKDKFVFYFIGENNPRKNLSALLKAYYLEFSPKEPVSLLIKSGNPGESPHETSQKISSLCEEIKYKLKIYKNSPDTLHEVIITQPMKEKELMMLHNTCDCFVMPSYGEAWCLPAMDALGMGKPVICTNFGGLRKFVSNSNGYLVDYTLEPVYGMENYSEDLYIGNEEWASIKISELRKAMRNIFEDTPIRKQKSNNAIETAMQYSYEAIGKQLLKGIMCEQ